MGKKITWDAIYKDFKDKHPNLKKFIEYWCPRDYEKITLYFTDGMLAVYDYFEHRVNFIGRWRKEN